MRHTHQPVIAVGEDNSQVRAFLRFLVPALIYSVRHLSLGTLVRLRRSYLRKTHQTWLIR